ncbi:hypothetical protein GBA52_008450, partial [Prunus armeniaca]
SDPYFNYLIRYAVVTGANKGIGLETVRQLASNGFIVVLTARDGKRGLEAVEKLKESGLSGQVVFHQLDVANPAIVASLADFIKTKFGKLDILKKHSSRIYKCHRSSRSHKGCSPDWSWMFLLGWFRQFASGGDRPQRVSTGAMKILAWNCQGIGGNLTVSSLKEQVKLHTHDMVLLLGTKTRSHRYGFLKKILGINFMRAVEARGLSGGLCLLWKEAQH